MTARAEPQWLRIARAELGTKEISGDGHTSRIIEYHATTSLRARDDETPWCSAFVNWCMGQAGYAGTNRANARSWLAWGRPLEVPVPGCVVILSRGSPSGQSGHVGFLVSSRPGFVRLLGGNQSNQVCEADYPNYRWLGYRWPVGVPLPGEDRHPDTRPVQLSAEQLQALRDHPLYTGRY